MLGTDRVEDGRDKFRDGGREILLDGGRELFREAGSEVPCAEKEERRGRIFAPPVTKVGVSKLLAMGG
jgi:hypothetical protein